MHFVNAWLLGGRYADLNADSEYSVAAWAGSATLASSAFLVFLLATEEPARRTRHLALASVLAFFSLDEVIAIHERIGPIVRGFASTPAHYDRIFWPTVYLPILVVAFLLLRGLRTLLPRRVAGALDVGLALLVAAVLAEAAGTLVGIAGGDGRWPGRVQVAVEEGLELAGWILVLAAVTVAARRAATRRAV